MNRAPSDSCPPQFHTHQRNLAPRDAGKAKQSLERMGEIGSALASRYSDLFPSLSQKQREIPFSMRDGNSDLVANECLVL